MKDFCSCFCFKSEAATHDEANVKISGNIKTVVVLVMENRSFDNVLGFLNRIHPDVDGLSGNEYNLVNVSDPKSKKVYVKDTEPYITGGDPNHGFRDIRMQIFGSNEASANSPLMNGFAQSAESVRPGFSSQVMSAFDPRTIPVTMALAKEFAVFDKWFASLPASTQPNRFYVHSATSRGFISNVTSDLIKGNSQKTLFESIEEAGLTFGIYYQQFPSTLFYSRLRKVKYIDNFLDYDPHFKSHARSGTLPNYTVIEQRYFHVPPHAIANDNHPPHDFTAGEQLLKEVYETLRKSPQWNEMAWIITYDEHGGFFDHVPPPVVGVPNPDGIRSSSPDFFNFDRLGVRVPTIVVSPWVVKGTVVHEPTGPTPSSQYEHSSISATLKKMFNLSGFLTKRDAWAGTFESIFTKRTTPRTDCPEVLPEVPSSKSKKSATRSRTTKKSCKTDAHTETETSSHCLHEWQQELLLLATHLKGDREVPEVKSVPEAHQYVKDAVTAYLKTERI